MAKRYTLIHLTDVHAVAEGLLHGSVDSTAAFRTALDTVVASGQPVDALIVSGDIADQGDEPSYRLVAQALQSAADKLAATVVVAMGNHDERRAFRSTLVGAVPGDGAGTGPGSGSGGGADDDPGRQAGDEPYDVVVRIGGLRVVVLDSTVPGAHHGELSDDQLEWLASALATPAPDGSVLVLHHPPVPSVLPLMDGIGLRAPEKLAGVLAGSDVRLVLTGHTHSASAGMFAGIPVWVGPGSAYGADTMAPAGRTRGMPFQAFSRVDVTEDGVITTVVPLSSAPPVYELDTQLLLDHLASHSG
ncbi:metallophosphoesterase [Streptosporangium carneum]|uniref:3',5'-cyclic adenosine monophosphate phosphodiesterase CpdA n=1 Tax=Streptosporangium carneum TaxID=47481 RepID=A0A9W6IB08_9ACTN|nr:metallophosphoesterase [Streptosporangium carneum]GLK14393.1 3',5'-cyclic adenosine monophosphate phosphodiesterase CpdA [Streptosporangium carneum]